MQISSIQNYSNTPKRAYVTNQRTVAQPKFTGVASVATAATEKASEGLYGKFTEWLANNYYKRFYNSKTAKFIVDHTKGAFWNNMTAHMSALGSTLISGMYVVKTLENDKLDPEKRKTLAINDGLTWLISTGCAYGLDGWLGERCSNAITRAVANYLNNNPASKRTEIFGDWDPKNLKIMMKEWYKHVKPDSKEGQKLLQELGNQSYSNIRDFNLDVLKDIKITHQIDGLSAMKSLFVFGMVYRYLVPVLVMKPANWIGEYIHKKNAQKAQEAQGVKPETKVDAKA